MDQFTLKHLDAWLADAERYDIRETIKTLMLAKFNTDPDYWQTQDWTKLRNAAVPQDVYNRLRAETNLQNAVDDMRGDQ